MASQVERTRRSTGTMVRILKIMEPSVPTAHDRFKTHPSDIAALHFIGENPGAQGKALAAHLGVAATTISSLLSRLEAAGLARRDRPPENRRSVALYLTDEGEASRTAILEEERETAKRMLAPLPHADREGFVRALELIAKGLSDEVKD
ncbi:MAG: MarR family transcriptional regulator [Pseudomonadota bacterium]